MKDEDQKLNKIISSGESNIVEFKRDFSNLQNALKTLCAFANTKGGYLIFGVDDNGQIIGVSIDNETRTRLGNFIDTSIDPLPKVNIFITKLQNKTIFVVEVEKGSGALYHYGTVAYTRIDTQDFPLKYHDAEFLKKEKETGTLKISINKVFQLIKWSKDSLLKTLTVKTKTDKKVNRTYDKNNKLLWWLVLLILFILSVYVGNRAREANYQQAQKEYKKTSEEMLKRQKELIKVSLTPTPSFVPVK